MTGRKGWLFRGKSAKPDSSNINPPSSNNAAPTTPQALPITPQANAHPAQDEISEIGSSLTSDSPTLAHAGRDKVAEIGSPSTPSAPSPQKLRDHAERAREAAEQYNKRIRDATEGLNEESDVAELSAVFELISQLSDFIKKEKQDKKEKKIKEKEKEKEKKKKTGEKKKGKEEENKLSEPKVAIDSWLRSKNLLKLKEVLYEAITAAKDFASSGDATKMVQGFLKDIGGRHVFNIVFIVVANAWERYEDMSKNEEACLSLLEEINKFAKIVIDLQKALQNDSESKEGMEASVNEAIELIIETCIACCTQIEASKRRSYWSTTRGGDELAKLEKQLRQMTAHTEQVIITSTFSNMFSVPTTRGGDELAKLEKQLRQMTAHTEQGLSNGENLLKQVQSKFDSMLTNGEGKPVNISGRPLNTLLLVMFDGRQEFRPRSFPLPLLEESIDDLQIRFDMVYFGNHWDQLPKKVADRILGHAPVNGDAKALFQELLPLVSMSSKDFDWLLTMRFQMTAEIVSGQKGDKYLSRWKVFDYYNDEVEDFVVTKCGRYVKLKQLAERPGGSPIALLTELFRGGKEEISISFLKNKDGESTKVGVDELKGKTILLDIRPANICYADPLQALVDMYVTERENFGFEIITVPIMQDNSKMDVSVKFSSEVPWLVLENPWQVTNATKYFLLEGRVRRPPGWDSWYLNTMRIIKSDGAIAPYRNPGVLRMVNTWGTAAYPFTAGKEEELIQKEKTQMEAISHAMFLFQHLERVAEQLREATRQQKMIFLYSCHQNEFTNSMKDLLTELSDIVHIIYIPDFSADERGQRAYFALTFGQSHATVEPSKMSAAEMPEMLWLSLSEYEAMRFWARIYSLKNKINFEDQFQLSKMLSRMTDENSSRMFIMDEDGNLITTQGKEIVEWLSENHSDDRVKEIMQKLLKGEPSWRKTVLLEYEEIVEIDGEDSEGDLEECDSKDSEGDLEEPDDAESQGNLSDADRDPDDADREGDDVFQEN